MSFTEVYFRGLLLIIAFVSLVWVLSVYLKNAGIVDIFWGLGFILVSGFYYFSTPDISFRKILVMTLVTIWGLRLSFHIYFRNSGKPEDYRYREFRKKYGENRYWWFSYFQVFLLQGTLIWLISAPLLAAIYFETEKSFSVTDIIAIIFWTTGFVFETVGDWQLKQFKAVESNNGKLLQTGLWKYTRHPNYFGDAAVWWGFAFFSIATECYIPVLSAVLMTWLIIKVSGVAMLERTLINSKPGFEDYVKKTNAFFPWFPKK